VTQVCIRRERGLAVGPGGQEADPIERPLERLRGEEAADRLCACQPARGSPKGIVNSASSARSATSRVTAATLPRRLRRRARGGSIAPSPTEWSAENRAPQLDLLWLGHARWEVGLHVRVEEPLPVARVVPEFDDSDAAGVRRGRMGDEAVGRAQRLGELCRDAVLYLAEAPGS
jgi:hypothetical protein